MKKVKNITKVLEGQKEVAVRVTYSDNTVETFKAKEGETASEVIARNVTEGKISLKGYNTNKRVLVEQVNPSDGKDVEATIKAAKRTEEAVEAAKKSEAKLNKNYSDVANFKVNMDGFKANQEVATTGRTETTTTTEKKSGKGRYVLYGALGTLMVGALVWAGCTYGNTDNCAPKAEASISRSANNDETPELVTKKVDGEEVVLVENSKLSEKEVKSLAKVACDSKYVAKSNYTQADVENVICLVNGLDMINTDCRVTDPYRVEQFFNDMTNQAIENYFNTNCTEIECYDYSKLYAEGSIECEALKNIENGFDKINDNQSAQEYFAKCYRVAQGLEVDGINVLEDTNEQFEGPFYYAVSDRAMLYNMKQSESLKIKAGLIWYDLTDDYKDVKYDTQELYNTEGVMEGLRLDFIQNALARCSEDAKVLSK